MPSRNTDRGTRLPRYAIAALFALLVFPLCASSAPKPVAPSPIKVPIQQPLQLFRLPLLLNKGRDVEVRDPASLALISTIPASMWGYGNATSVAMFDRYAYIAFYDSGKIVRYDVSGGTQGPVWTVTHPTELTFAGSTLTFFASGLDGGVEAIDLSTGAMRVIQPYNIASTVRFLSGDASGRLFSVMIGNAVAVQFNVPGVGLTVPGVYGLPTQPIFNASRVAASPDGSRLFVSGNSKVWMFYPPTAIDISPTQPNGLPILSVYEPVGLAVSPDSSTVYIADAGSMNNPAQVYANMALILASAKNLQEIARIPIPIAHRSAELRVSPTTGLVYGVTAGGLYVFEPVSGRLTTVELTNWCVPPACGLGSIAISTVALVAH